MASAISNIEDQEDRVLEIESETGSTSGETTFSATEDCSGLCCRFRIKWTVPKDEFAAVKDLSNCDCFNDSLGINSHGGLSRQTSCCDAKDISLTSHFMENMNDSFSDVALHDIKTVRSKLFNMSSVGNVSFHLGLGFIKGRYFITIERKTGVNHDSVEIQYAFVAWNNKIYQLAYATGSNTLQNIQRRFLTDDVLFNNQDPRLIKRNLVIHLMITVYADVYSLAYDSGQTNSKKFGNFVPNSSELPDIPCKKSSFDNYVEKLSFRNELWQFWNGGKFPVLDIQKAKLLITHNNVIKCDTFRALGVEYLINCLNKHTVLDLLVFSISNKIEYLKNACLEFLFEKCKIVKIETKKDRTSFV